jgi:hypothetical protein
MASLATLAVLPFWVFGPEAGGWEARLTRFKAIAILATVVYFVAGTTWMNENGKRWARGGQ